KRKSATLCVRAGESVVSWRFQNGRHSHAARRADGDQAAPLPFRVQQLAECGDDASAGCGEWMAYGQGTAFDIHSTAVDGTERGVASEHGPAILLAFPRLERAQHLCGEGFMNFIEVEVLQ